eukprot:gene47366-64209_t
MESPDVPRDLGFEHAGERRLLNPAKTSYFIGRNTIKPSADEDLHVPAVQNIRSTLATVWRIAAPYFRSEDKWMARGLLAAVIVIELAVVGLNVLFNRWNNVFYNALQERNLDVFTYQLGYFSVLAAIFIALKVYQLYLNQWLQIRWRRWMTERYLGGWLSH